MLHSLKSGVDRAFVKLFIKNYIPKDSYNYYKMPGLNGILFNKKLIKYFTVNQF
jgi:hypothetical protein